MTKKELFLELADPDVEGNSRWVDIREFTGKYASLSFGNGASWARKEQSLAKEYFVEFDKSQTSGVSIDRVRLQGKHEDKSSDAIKTSIKKEIKKERCIVLGTSNPEVDHKNGRKNEKRVMEQKEQRLSDFQPLSKAANDAKRQACKNCKKTGIRFDAKQLYYPMSYYSGGAEHNDTEDGCCGCYWYDTKAFRSKLAVKED